MSNINIQGKSFSIAVNRGPLNGGAPGGSLGQLQFNDGAVLGGVANTIATNGNLIFTNLANLQIEGGDPGQTIVTDGDGNLSFADIGRNDYGNANVAAFLPTYTGNLSANNITSGNIVTTGSGGNITGANVVSAKTFRGNVVAVTVTSGNIVPTANGVYSLGTPSSQWKDLHVSGNTIYIGNVPISTSNNSLVINGNVAVTTDPASGAPTPGNIAITGTVTAESLYGNVAGINVVGQVASANTAQVVVGAIQSAITQVGTLTTIQISGRADLGDVSNVKISGGSLGYLLQTNGNSDLSWTDMNRGSY